MSLLPRANYPLPLCMQIPLLLSLTLFCCIKYFIRLTIVYKYHFYRSWYYISSRTFEKNGENIKVGGVTLAVHKVMVETQWALHCLLDSTCTVFSCHGTDLGNNCLLGSATSSNETDQGWTKFIAWHSNFLQHTFGSDLPYVYFYFLLWYVLIIWWHNKYWKYYIINWNYSKKLHCTFVRSACGRICLVFFEKSEWKYCSETRLRNKKLYSSRC